MAQIDNHLRWCLKEPNRLKKVEPDSKLAQEHVKKSEYNAEVMKLLEKAGKYDWALNVGFYTIYHCFLAILAKYGYESKNQSCSITLLCFAYKFRIISFVIFFIELIYIHYLIGIPQILDIL